MNGGVARVGSSTGLQVGLGAGALFLAGVGLYAWRKRRSGGRGPAEAAPYPNPDFEGPLGSQLKKAHELGWLDLFRASEEKHGLPGGILAAIASQETMKLTTTSPRCRPLRHPHRHVTSPPRRLRSSPGPKQSGGKWASDRLAARPRTLRGSLQRSSGVARGEAPRA